MAENNMTEEQQMQAILEQLQNAFDPRDFMTPTQREIAELTLEELDAEYQQVQSKTSSRGRTQRDYIVTRYEFEQNKKQDLNNQNNA
jgi:hypothetical protein